MSRKKLVSALSVHRQELKDLQARKSAVDTLIQSLEAYDRFRAPQVDYRKLKMA